MIKNSNTKITIALHRAKHYRKSDVFRIRDTQGIPMSEKARTTFQNLVV